MTFLPLKKDKKNVTRLKQQMCAERKVQSQLVCVCFICITYLQSHKMLKLNILTKLILTGSLFNLINLQYLLVATSIIKLFFLFISMHSKHLVVVEEIPLPRLNIDKINADLKHKSLCFWFFSFKPNEDLPLTLTKAFLQHTHNTGCKFQPLV